MDYYAERIDASPVLEVQGLEAGRYFVVTMHRAENVDLPERLGHLVQALVGLYERYGFPVICSLHPRTRSKMQAFGLPIDQPGVRFVEPLGFFDFIRLEQGAFCTLSDSGTVQEEACIMGVPNVTIRDVTERPETLECGSNVLCGSNPEQILRLVEFVTRQERTWDPPPEYLAPCPSHTVLRILLGYRMPDAAEVGWQGGPR
jgi:UDP-N-acetylglucosamine 2-epimerase (non-hydrolysing)